MQTVCNYNMIKSIKHNIALKLDSIGFIASTICAIHCMAMPFILLLLTLYGLEFIANPIFEITFIATSVAIGVFTFRHGYFNHHKKAYPFLIFICGLVLIIGGHFIHDHNQSEIHGNNDYLLLMISPIGAFLIGLGHFINRKLSKICKAKSCDC